MKRGFLFGFCWFLVISIIAPLTQGHVLGALILIPVSIIVRAAKGAPLHYSRLHAVVEWLLGFLMLDAVALAIVGIVWIFPSPT
jgi:hypothetical protein